MVGRRRDSKQSATLLKSRQDQCQWADNLQPPHFLGPCQLTPELICPGDQCACSSISYLLAAACDACLPRPSNLSWDDYSEKENCNGSFQSFPGPLPTTGQHAIPPWASVLDAQNPEPTAFDLAAASSTASLISANSGVFPTSSSRSHASSASETPTNSATSSSNQPGPSLPVNPSTTSTPAPSAAPLTAASKSSSHAGPIAGGIIGGALFLALVGVAIWYTVVRRRRNHIAPSAAYKAAVRAGTPMPYQPVHHDESPKNSAFKQTDDLRPERSGSWLPSAAVSIRSESRFLEHT
ncbi:hypothetical protein FB451DRAFT_1293863 [Mycena latifolia]|nr:hypothetical protein FB451DRAFT_1293863 [Mycena latifolia]